MKKLNQMKCNVCNSNTTIINTVNGYEFPEKYNVYFCSGCEYEFVDSGDKDLKSLYEKIYMSSNLIPGYNRYNEYYNEIKRHSRPLEYLAKQDSIYFSVQKVLQDIKPDCVLEL